MHQEVVDLLYPGIGGPDAQHLGGTHRVDDLDVEVVVLLLVRMVMLQFEGHMVSDGLDVICFA